MESGESHPEKSKVTFDGRMQYFNTIGKLLEDIREANMYSDIKTQFNQLKLLYDMAHIVLNIEKRKSIEELIDKINNRLYQINFVAIPEKMKAIYRFKAEQDISQLRMQNFFDAKELLTAVKQGDEDFSLDDFGRGSDL